VPSLVEVVVRTASRRRFVVVATEQLALALAIGLGGGILMLLLGTEILHWYWLVLLGCVGIGVAAVRIRARLLTGYRVAQILDRRLELSDSISTAWFLLTHGDSQTGGVARLQIQRAEELAAKVRPGIAFPFTGLRAWVLPMTLAAAGFGLFAVRYLVTSSLSLRESLVPLRFDVTIERLQDAFANAGRGHESHSGNVQKSNPERSAEAQQNEAQLRLQTPGASAPGTPDPSSQNQLQEQSGQAQEGKPSQNSTGPQGRDGGDQAERQTAGEKDNAQNGSQQTSNTRELQDPQQAGQQSSNGVFDRMKDALSGLMAKMRPNNGTQKQNESARSSDEKKAAEQNATNNEEGSPEQQSASNQQARQQQDAQGQGQATEKTQTARGSNANQASDKNGSDSQSGIGRQNGDKTIKEAEEQKAMGKLADIIGKRSASVTGDMTVETASGQQQLQTQYSGRMGVHSDTGGEINRDAIPVEFQQYVRDYMEQVRKQQNKSQ